MESPILSQIYGARQLSKQELDGLQKSAQEAKTLEEKEQQVATRLGAEPSDPPKPDSHPSSDHLLVRKDTGKLVSICFGLPQINMEIERASTQVRKETDKEMDNKTQKEGIEK